MMTASLRPGTELAQRLRLLVAGGSRVTDPYRLARMVARVLVSSRLQQRHKWCDFAKELAADPMVEDRLVHQAMGWLERRKPFTRPN